MIIPSRAQLLATAYHEASHAVAARHLGIGFGREGLTIISGDDFAGRFSHSGKITGNPEFKVNHRMRGRAEDQAMVCSAGIDGQRHHRASSIRNFHASSDFHCPVDILSYFEPCTEGIKLLQYRARTLITNPLNWNRIEPPILLWTRELSGRDAKAATIQLDMKFVQLGDR